jgi:serine/threonine protein kinase
MNKFQIMEQLGDGSFGSVLKAKYIDTGEYAAIKRMKKKYHSWDECLALREIKVQLINTVTQKAQSASSHYQTTGSAARK